MTYSSGSWSSPSTLTSGAGTSNTRVVTADFESKSGNLMVVYRKASNSTLYYRTYTVASPPEQSFSIGLSSAPTWLEIIGKPAANEMVLVAASGSSLRAGIWNGTSWGNSTSLESNLAASGRPFHVAYMNKSGMAMVVWTATSGAPKYATWDGTSWSGSASLPGIAGGVAAGWIKLEGSPLRSSDEVLMACIGTNNQINVNNWTGSAWGSNLTIETSAAANTRPRVDVSYQPDGAKALVVWHKSGQNSLPYRTWSGGAWSSQQTGPDMTAQTQTLRLVRGFNSTEIMMLARRSAGTSYADYNVYSQNSTVTTSGTVITGSYGGNTGYSLPAPPSGTAGTNNIAIANNTTQTIAPGTYGSLTAGDADTINFSAGTYIFSTWTFHDREICNLDSSAGPVIIIVTTGGISDHDQTTFNNTGNGPVQINITGGDLLLHDSETFTNIDMLVYNGSATYHANTNGTLNLYASGAIVFQNQGTISPNPLGFGAPPACSAVLWTSGSPGARSDLSTSLVPAGVADPIDLAGDPMPSSAKLDSWAAVAP
jgi:hypothetical protein